MHIGFLPIGIFDILDILIVTFLIYQLYKLLRGSIAINIFIGVVIFLVLSRIVRALNMEMLTGIMSQIINIGAIILIIIFQPEVRRFLLLLGNTTLRQRSNLINKLLDRKSDNNKENNKTINQISTAIINLSKRKEGALIVLTRGINMDNIRDSGILLNAEISPDLIENIFFKNSPLHDGAMLIDGEKIIAAAVILPVSNAHKLSKKLGLRHRAAIGVTERLEVAAFVVSEETGGISVAFEGNIQTKLNPQQLKRQVRKHIKAFS